MHLHWFYYYFLRSQGKLTSSSYDSCIPIGWWPVLQTDLLLIKIRLQGATATYVAGPAVEPSSQRIGMTDVHFDG